MLAFQGYLPSPAAGMAQFTLGGLPHGHRYEWHECFAGCEVLRFEEMLQSETLSTGKLAASFA